MNLMNKSFKRVHIFSKILASVAKFIMCKYNWENKWCWKDDDIKSVYCWDYAGIRKYTKWMLVVRHNCINANTFMKKLLLTKNNCFWLGIIVFHRNYRFPSFGPVKKHQEQTLDAPPSGVHSNSIWPCGLNRHKHEVKIYHRIAIVFLWK